MTKTNKWARMCSKCQRLLDARLDFYFYKGKPRGNCKKCCIAYVSARQKALGPKKLDYFQHLAKCEAARQYYQDNKEKYAKYRATFLAKHPGYFKDYYEKHKQK